MTLASKPKFDVYSQEFGKLTVTQKDHVATGGEGSVFVLPAKGLAIKIFTDPNLAKSNGMEDKVNLFAKFSQSTDPTSAMICYPRGNLYDDTQRLVGYYMRIVNGIPLVKTFSNAWRDQNGFTDQDASFLVGNMRHALEFAHSQKALVVDGNEMNYLVDIKSIRKPMPIMIDVDSWAIGSHKATAIMMSVRDHHAAQFSELTDWFSWGVVSFQVYTGIHPYKGTNAGFRKSDLEGRMKANASVFDPATSVNSAVRDFKRIPANLLDWYEATFQKGERSTPPDPMVVQTVAAPGFTRKLKSTVSSTGSVTHELKATLPGQVFDFNGDGFVKFQLSTGVGFYDVLKGKTTPAYINPGNIEAFRTASEIAIVSSDGRKLTGVWLDGVSVKHIPEVGLQVSELYNFTGKPAVITPHNLDNGVRYLSLVTLGNEKRLTVDSMWPVNPNSATFYRGFGVMNVLGSKWAAMPTGTGMSIKALPGLEGHEVVDGIANHKAGLIYLMALDRKTGEYKKLLYQNPEAWTTPELIGTSDDPQLNAAILDTGLVVEIPEDGEISVYHPKSGKSKKVQDGSVKTSQTLFSVDTGIYYYIDNLIYKLSVK